MIYGIYFSPTGSTKVVVEYLAEADKLIDITNEKIKIEFCKDDVVYVGVPSFGGRVPGLALERMNEIVGNNARAVLISTYGNRASEDTLIELSDFLKNKGFTILCGIEAVCRHSIFTEVAKDRPDLKDFLDYDYFKKKIESLLLKEYKEPIIPGNRPYKMSKPAKLIPLTNSFCNDCGLCVKKCPTKAIDSNNFHKIDENLCISCMRCIHICPSHAKHIEEKTFKILEEKLMPFFAERKNNNFYC